MAEYSPMMRQYLEIKEHNKDHIVFFRLGDFYEMFFDDALLASKELELTLTGRECGKEERAPMCGVPYHSAEGYIARLVEKGYKVAICEQTEDAAAVKGIVKREVTRVVTPGTIIENSMLSDERNNYIASIFIDGGAVGLCFADISTGNAYVTSIFTDSVDRGIIAELARYNPSEVLFNSEILKHKPVTGYIKTSLTCSVELLDDDEFNHEKCKGRLERQFGGDDENFYQDEHVNEARAMGALLMYLDRTQKTGVERLRVITRYSEEQYMLLPPLTKINLEICETMRGRQKKGSLLWVLDKTSTAMGKRLLRSWLEKPLMQVGAINARLDAVAELYSDNICRLEIAEALSGVFDMERLVTRVVYGSATPRDIAALGMACKKMPVIRKLVGTNKSDELMRLYEEMDELFDVQSLIEKALEDELPAKLADGGIIREGYHPEVDSLRRLVHGDKGMLASIEARLKEETGIRTLKIGYNKVFGYYIEVSKSFVQQVPQSFIRKQTLANGERYITEELKKLEDSILHAGDKLLALERELYAQLLQAIASQLDRIQRTAFCIARLDVLCALAQAAVANNYTRPQVDDSDVVHIVDGRHAVVEQMPLNGPFVPNTARLDGGEGRVQIITGPNMAGKSTYMRQTALMVIMAQIGSFVPAAECRIGICDAVYTRVGAYDELASGASTFMVEMREVAEILENATPKSLVILDEIGRGTSTFDGMSIAQAVVEYITGREFGIGCKTMFATHYHELTALENALDGVKNYNIAVKKRGDDITFLRRIVRGPADDSYGIQVAKLAGLPDAVVLRAKDVLRTIEKNAAQTTQVSQLDFEAYEEMSAAIPPNELIEKIKAVDPETLTPLEALKLVYDIKQMLEV